MIGDSNDILQRVRKVLPRRWFSWGAPIRDALLGGLSDGAAWCYSWIGYARQQSRIATSSGIFLDIVAWDFFGANFVRRSGENDASFQPRILQEILRPRQTRDAISQVLTDLTSKPPKIIELWNPQDCGGYGVAQMGGYGSGPGCYGSLLFDNQMLVSAYHAPTQGIPNVDGYGGYNAGYGVGTIEYADLSLITGPITDAEIYARVQQTIAAGTIAWVAIQNPPTLLITDESGIALTADSGDILVVG
ncbi:hypothetical protein [Bradyrhizobium erythrophlei]|uniref:Uncharacterized protein n=1 Tax=Bradyrhizobium erythrophlei TaxID=1437360 RepID=A0A1M5NTI3_9BRAD|nr:hypothetical protein [Bradyrhizobium erythrophlei]SHG92263.1 hypothetical protein SAMN05443248_3094 [Bradyrhizobium erythrophlei]